MPIHIGKKIKEEVYRQRIPIITFAKKINRSRNVVYDIFERESIDTDLLNKISKILSCDFFSMYSAQYAQEGIRTFLVKDPAVNYGKFAEDAALMQQQNQLLKNEMAYLKKIISLLEEKKENKSVKKNPRSK